jgi:hypothetical protein
MFWGVLALAAAVATALIYQIWPVLLGTGEHVGYECGFTGCLLVSACHMIPPASQQGTAHWHLGLNTQILPPVGTLGSGL